MMTDPAASRPGTHLDPDRMADLFEGLLDGAAAEEARAHLASCRLCAADYALIAGEADLGDLGDLLPPTPIPHDVMARVEAALYREPPLVAPSAPAPVGHHAAAASAASPARRRRFRIRLGALAGATLVVVGGIGVITAVNGGSGKGSSHDSTAAGSAPSSQSGSGAHADSQAPDGAMSPQVGVAPNTKSPAREPSRESVGQQAENLLKQHGQTAAGTGEFGEPVCAPEGVAAGTRLLASTQTQYAGKPAVLLVYAESDNTTVADVYVVDSGTCTSDNPGQVLDHVTVPRP